MSSKKIKLFYCKKQLMLRKKTTQSRLFQVCCENMTGCSFKLRQQIFIVNETSSQQTPCESTQSFAGLCNTWNRFFICIVITFFFFFVFFFMASSHNIHDFILIKNMCNLQVIISFDEIFPLFLVHW